MSDEIAGAGELGREARARTMAWMASLAFAAGDMRAVEGYLLELLSICVLAGVDGKEVGRGES